MTRDNRLHRRKRLAPQLEDLTGLIGASVFGPDLASLGSSQTGGEDDRG